MNANELADGIESCTTDYLHYKAATMLRQQQAEIETLKQVLGRYVKEVPLGNQPHMLAHIALELVNG